jgi:hypothetical protein
MKTAQSVRTPVGLGHPRRVGTCDLAVFFAGVAMSIGETGVHAVAAQQPSTAVGASPTQANPANHTLLLGVSCTSDTTCTAVGYTYPALNPDKDCLGSCVTPAEHWNGKVWQVQPTPNHAGISSSVFSDVPCSSAKSCAAVGYYADHGATKLSEAVARARAPSIPKG